MKLKKLVFFNIIMLMFKLSFSEDNWCRDIAGSSASYSLGKIIKASNYYVDNAAEYPNNKVQNCPIISSNCMDKYNPNVNANSEVIVGKTYKNFTCVYDTKKQVSGWVPSDRLFKMYALNFKLESLLGTWHSDASKINIKQNGDNAIVSGTSKWDGIIDENGERIEHIGEFHGNALVSNLQTGAFEIYDDEMDCRVKFNFVNNKYLIVSDNSNCGGMNVRFNGVYKRKLF